ncbi:PD-(D/E)XK nuclease family protein [Nitrosophilus kaiyonis]|uniref:PD-(D/E)XK nuclease family protein n=1 Tax=Nitrosophilus kaiyonis TaxID=2930200 RepID=UPI0024911B07|nr:PD-(D/E)XK nuclease family protein [Nitrosophilus kaiyonis]
MILKVFPTARSLRNYRDTLLKTDSFLPNLLTIGDFEKKAVVVKDRVLIDDDTRVVLLKNAADFKEFKNLKIEDEFFSFIKNSDYFFRFFEELSQERVDIEKLFEFDVYAEYYEHLTILEKLQKRYIKELEKNGFYDKIILPKIYKINENFIKNYERIEIFVEGILTNFELEILEKISNITELILIVKTSKYNQKAIKRFEKFGFEFEIDKEYELNITKKEIKVIKELSSPKEITSIKLSNSAMQVYFIKKKIYDFINTGLLPEKIVVIMPDESFKNYLNLFDEINNLNFAMGFDFKNRKIFKILSLFEKFISNDHIRYGYEIEKFNINELFNKWKKYIYEHIDFETYTKFINDFKEFGDEKDIEIIDEKLYEFQYIYNFLHDYSFKKKLHLFLNRLKDEKIEDNSGGKITVIGSLETRGSQFDGVIVVDFNEGKVPKPSQKDIFLDSNIRKKVGLPTSKDREDLQKYYYYELFRSAKKVSICYIENDVDTKSRFLDELDVKKEDFNEEGIKSFFIKKFQKKDNSKEIILEYDFKKTKISPTKLKDFLECKRRFYYKYIQNIEDFDIPSLIPKENEIGNIIHNILLKLYSKKRRYSDIETIQKSFFSLIEDESKNRNLFFKLHMNIWNEKIKKVLENDIKRFNEGFKVYQVERKKSINYKGFILEGKIDRIDFNDEYYQIIDYKTGKIDNKIKKDLSKVNDFQLTFYYLLSKDLGDIEGAYYYDLNEAVLKKEMQLDEKIEELGKILESLNKKNINFSKCEEEKFCRFCPYKILCDRD